MLSERFGVGRTYVRDAIRKLEFYGILKTLPQSGTVVAGFGVTALDGLITDVLELEGTDFHALVEDACDPGDQFGQVCGRATNQRRHHIHCQCAECLREGSEGRAPRLWRKTLMFHLKITEASKNSVLKSLMLIVTPDIITFFTENDVCSLGISLNQRWRITTRYWEYINNKDPENAVISMQNHLRDLLNFSNKNGSMKKT